MSHCAALPTETATRSTAHCALIRARSLHWARHTPHECAVLAHATHPARRWGSRPRLNDSSVSDAGRPFPNPIVRPMLKLSRRHSHYVFAVIQSGLTSAIAAAIASLPVARAGAFVWHWLTSWLLSWATMLPVVMAAAPFIRRLVTYVSEKSPD